jgi:MoaA/NifB/PqqE/SkfB family radical SAM enzyme
MDSAASTDAGARAAGNRKPAANLLPAICDVSVTNVCNAACDFCGFSRDKNLIGARRYLDLDQFKRALPFLRRRRIRFLTFQGGEPLVHPQIDALVAEATAAEIQCGLITNGWFLSRHVDALVAAGLKRLLISIDSDSMPKHEANRGLDGLDARIRDGIARAHAHGLPVWACVTVTRLVDFAALPQELKRLGFDAVVFSYPRRERFGSNSLVYSEESDLMNQGTEELLSALDSIQKLKRKFPVLDPGAALSEVARFVRGEKQLVACIAGHKYFYIDWNLDVWRCEPWAHPMGSVFELDTIPDQREPCHACMSACYRHASVMMHGPLALTDAAQSMLRGNLREAVSALFQRGIGLSLWALAAGELPRVTIAAWKRHNGKAPQ